MNPNIIKKTHDIIKKSSESAVGYIDKEGYPHVATRSIIQPTGMFTCYFSTDTSGNMAQCLQHNNRGSLCFRHGNDNITLMGTFQMVEDMKVKESMWIDWFINHYPGGYTDPEFCLLKFTCERASLWVDGEIARFNISDLLTVQSRCGLLCSTCTFTESHHCNQCIPTNGHPFYGECPIAACCQAKGYEHCGLCPDMPCDALHEYSCGDSEHCDQPKGARLEILQQWADTTIAESAQE